MNLAIKGVCKYRCDVYRYAQENKYSTPSLNFLKVSLIAYSWLSIVSRYCRPAFLEGENFDTDLKSHSKSATRI